MTEREERRPDAGPCPKCGHPESSFLWVRKSVERERAGLLALCEECGYSRDVKALDEPATRT